jgi:fluoride exporter
MHLAAVAAGGAIGATARFLMGGAIQRLAPSFPYGTFAVNVLGCVVFGVIVALSESRTAIGPGARAFLLTGVIGGFTTFSSFGYETFELLRDGRVLAAAANIGGQMALGLLGVWAGLAIGRTI